MIDALLIVFVALVIVFCIMAIVIHELRTRANDAEFIASELGHSLRQLLQRCTHCNGHGRRYIPGGTVSCPVCWDARLTLQRLLERDAR